MKTKLMTLLAALGLAGASVQAATILFEDFEDSTVTYTTSVTESSDGSTDYFGRVGSGGISISSSVILSGGLGTGFFAAQDMDAEVADGPQSLTFSALDITGLTDIEFSIYFAEEDDGSNQDWDATGDFLHITYSIDAGPAQNLIWIENDGSTYNTAPLLDTDFDGIGDGTEITDTFTQFTADISGTGSSLILSIEMDLDSGDEDIAFDNIQITAIPEPSSIMLMGLVGVAAALILRKRKQA